MKRQRKEFPQCELMFLPIRSNTDDDGILRHVSSQRAMEFIPPAKNRAPIRIGLALHDGVMNAMHPRRNNDQVQQAFQFNRQTPVGMTKGCCHCSWLLLFTSQLRHGRTTSSAPSAAALG